MKSIMFALALTSASAFADQLHCLCTGEGLREEMTCDQFREAGHCTFTDRLANNVVWQKDFVANGQGIQFSWTTNGAGRQEAVLQPGLPFDFQYYGDPETYTMICNYSN